MDAMKSGAVQRLVQLIVLGAVAFVGWRAWQRHQRAQVQLPEGITAGNGRIEAIQVDIATKYAGPAWAPVRVVLRIGLTLRLWAEARG